MKTVRVFKTHLIFRMDTQTTESKDLDIITLWENNKKPPSVDQILESLNTNNIYIAPAWSERVSLAAKRNMVKFFLDMNLESYKGIKISPWFFFLLAKHFKLSPATTRQVLEAYASSIKFRENGFLPDSSGSFRGEFQCCNIDPRWWFGSLTQLGRLPPFYSNILEQRFSKLKTEYPEGTVFKVSATGRHECQLPDNFHFGFISHLQSLKMFTEYYNTCPLLETSLFSQNPGNFSEPKIVAMLDEFDDSIFLSEDLKLEINCPDIESQ